MVAALITVIAMAAAPAAQPDPPARAAAPSGEARPDPARASPPSTFLDSEGNPLPADVQRDLQEQFKDGPPPVKEPPAPPAPSAAAAPKPGREGEIVVQGQRPRGSVIGDIMPEREFSALDIDAYGAGNVGELIGRLGPQVTSSGGQDGRPVTLLNGRRVSSFAEIAEIPTEAIERMEVFPEELALRYGYRANQKVVNIVTFEKFSSRLGELAFVVPTRSGRTTARTKANYFAIRGDTRFDLSAEYNRATALRESDRGLAQLGGSPDPGRFRTLLPETEQLALGGLFGLAPFDNVSSTLNGRLDLSRGRDLLGRNLDSTLRRDSETRAGHLGTTLHGQADKWLWTFTGNYDLLATRVSTDRAGAGARDRARSDNKLANADLVLSGALLKLPAGPVSATIGGRAEFRDFTSDSRLAGIHRSSDLSRDLGSVRANVNVPVSSRRSKGGARLGNLSVHAGLELERLSDLGNLRTFGYGFNWSPARAISLVGTFTAEEGAPTVEQLGEPLLSTPNLRTFDFARGEVVDVDWISGGNPQLRLEDRKVLRLGLNARPLAAADLTLSVDYVSTRVDDPIAPFPILTPRIEAAFPERFTRSADGRLVAVDGRPLNFERSDRRNVRWGFSFARPLGKADPLLRTAPVRTYSSEAEARAAAPAGAIVTMVQPGSAMARRFENMASRLYVSVFHSWQLRDELLVRSGLPALDLLDGSAVDLLGGTRRHRIEAQAGIFKRGLGASLTLDWRDGSAVREAGAGGGDLAFSGVATLGVQLFANLAERFGGSEAPEWLKGARLTFGIANLLDSRPRVRDGSGSTPLSYQTAYLDPIGRQVSLGLRKTF